MTLLSAGALVRDLANGRGILADGAMGSELIDRGAAPADVGRANLILPDLVRAIHEENIAAGARIIATNTFAHGACKDWADITAAGVAIAHETAAAAEVGVAIVFSLAPGVLSREHAALGELFRSGRLPEFALIETCLTEAECVEAVHSARSLGFEYIACTANFDQTGALRDGAPAEEFAATAVGAGAVCVGANCGVTPESFVDIAERMRRHVGVPLLFQPSAGLPTRSGSSNWIYPVDPARFARAAGRLVEVGVQVIGGCCGASPSHIRAAGERLFPSHRR